MHLNSDFEDDLITRSPAVLGWILVCASCATVLGQQVQTPQSVVTASSPAKAVLGKINISATPNGLTITIAVSSPVSPIANRISNPERLVLDFPGCEMKGANRPIAIGQGPVKDLRLALFSLQPLVTRVVVDSTAPLDYQIKPWSNGAVVVEIPFPMAQVKTGESVHPAAILKKEPLEKEPAEKEPLAKEPAAIEEEPKVPTGPEVLVVPSVPQAPTTTPAGGNPAETKQPGAYTLMTKAKELTVGDLQAVEEKAAGDDPEAQTMLALAYHSGVLLKQDDTQAVNLLHKAADRGYMAAEESLGIFAEGGIGTPQPSFPDALNWYEKAVQHGSLDAATNIALIYANGKGVEKDPAKAVTWFRRAAHGGEAAAQYNLALLYERGEGVPKDYREAVRWLTAAADQDVIPAIMNLAEFSMQPPDPALNKDIGKAVQYYEKAANLGNSRAQVNLATIFSKGLLGQPDYEQAAKWYRKAAEQGERDGEFGLGVSYALGRGVPVDYEEAKRWFTSSAAHGQAQAQYDLGMIYEEGKGTPADHDLAAHYYELAAEQGMVKAQYRYGVLLAQSKGSRSDRVAAYKWLMLAQDSIKESSVTLSDVRKLMSQPEIAEAEHDVDVWRLAHRQLSH